MITTRRTRVLQLGILAALMVSAAVPVFVEPGDRQNPNPTVPPQGAGQAPVQGPGMGRGRVFADLWEAERFATCDQCVGQRIERLKHMNLTQCVSPVLTCAACEN